MSNFRLWGPGSDTSGDDGFFRIPLAPHHGPGTQVKLTCVESDHRIFVPLFGELILTKSSDQLVKVVAARKRSKLILSPDSIESFIERTAGESAKETKPKDAPRTDLSRYIVELGKEYGFTETEVREQIREWMEEAKEDPTNFRRLGLAAFAEENFDLAGENFLESARRNDSEAARDYELAGDSFYNGLRFRKALEAYTKARKRVDRRAEGDRWQSITVSLANTHLSLGTRVNPSEANDHLKSAADIYRSVLAVLDRRNESSGWAGTQNNLGITLKNQGIRLGGAEGLRLLQESVTAYREALKVYTEKDMPQDWAGTQNNLSITLMEQAIRIGGSGGAAVAAGIRHRLSRSAQGADRDGSCLRTGRVPRTIWALLFSYREFVWGERRGCGCCRNPSPPIEKRSRFILRRICLRTGRVPRTIWAIR